MLRWTGFQLRQQAVDVTQNDIILKLKPMSRFYNFRYILYVVARKTKLAANFSGKEIN